MHAQEERAPRATAAARARERESNDELLFRDVVHTFSLWRSSSYIQPLPRARWSRRPMRPTRAPHTRSDLRDPSATAFGPYIPLRPAAMVRARQYAAAEHAAVVQLHTFLKLGYTSILAHLDAPPRDDEVADLAPEKLAVFSNAPLLKMCADLAHVRSTPSPLSGTHARPSAATRT
jgi:hypothetical protein